MYKKSKFRRKNSESVIFRIWLNGKRASTSWYLPFLKNECKTSSTPQTNWSHSLSQGIATHQLLKTINPSIDWQSKTYKVFAIFLGFGMMFNPEKRVANRFQISLESKFKKDSWLLLKKRIVLVNFLIQLDENNKAETMPFLKSFWKKTSH